MIKFVDLAAQNQEVMAEVEAALRVLHQYTAYVGGPQVGAFERDFARFLGVRRVVGVSSGTDALRLALLATGVGPGCEVITTPMTFIATVEAIVQTGATPAFVDVDPGTANLSPAALREYVLGRRGRTAGRPRALVPVHLYGLPADMAALRALCGAQGLEIIEDACQAHGARLREGERYTQAGAQGLAGCFSFYPGKNLGAWGEAGAVATDDDELAGRIENLRDHGRLSHYAHAQYGYNARLDSIQAVVLRAKLAHLEDWNRRRRRVAALYRELLAGCEDVDLPGEPAGLESCYHLFVIRSPRRDQIRQALLAERIECGIHYPVPLHLQPACRSLGYRRGEFPHSERIADQALSLPMHPHLSEREVELVAQTVRASLRRAAHV